MAEDIYYGRGSSEMYEDYLDFINYVFGFNGNQQDFYKLLPKLYHREYDPVPSNYVAVENGKFKAAIGAYDHEIEVCGHRLKCRGIGNVAVHPYARSRGYMKKLLHMAMDDMVKDGVVLSTLGGRRQRYNYFSFEKAGTTVRFSVNSDNMRHTYGADRSAYRRYTLKEVREQDEAILDGISALVSTRDFMPVRPREQLLDILRSWQMGVYAFMEGDVFAGYALIRDGNKLTEAMMVEESPENIRDAIICLFDTKHVNDYHIAPFATPWLAVLYPLAESYDQQLNKSFSVLNFEAVCQAFFDLKTTYDTMPDGELCLLIHGRAGDEKLKFTVRDGKPQVTEAMAEDVPFMELSHLDAIRLLFSHFCAARVKLPAYARIWFPLPLFVYAADEV